MAKTTVRKTGASWTPFYQPARPRCIVLAHTITDHFNSYPNQVSVTEVLLSDIFRVQQLFSYAE